MKRLFAPVLALLLGCVEVPPPKISPAPSEPIHLQSDVGPVTKGGRSPSIDVPRGWVIDREHREIFEGMTTILIAQTPRPVGKIRTSLTVSMRPWEYEDRIFAIIVPVGISLKGTKFTTQEMITISSALASRTSTTVEGNLITQVNLAIDGIAYIVLCTGTDTDGVRKTCRRLLDSISLESGHDGI